MTLMTDKGLTVDVDWAWSPTIDGRMMAQLQTALTVAEAAERFDGCAHMHTSDPHEGERDHDGYTRLIGVMVDPEHGTTQLTWDKGGGS